MLNVPELHLVPGLRVRVVEFVVPDDSFRGLAGLKPDVTHDGRLRSDSRIDVVGYPFSLVKVMLVDPVDPALIPTGFGLAEGWNSEIVRMK